MRFVPLLLLVASLLPAAARPVKVLVTGFAPFADRSANGSATLAGALAADPPAGVELRTLVLPVVWGAPEAEALPLIASWRPDLLLGLGEGAPGYVSLETRAVNRRKGADVAGDPPPAARVLADGPAERAGRLAFALEPGMVFDRPVVISRDAGHYLCNNAFYCYLGTETSRVGFVHLPPQGESTDGAYAERHLPFVRRIIAANLSDPGGDGAPEP